MHHGLLRQLLPGLIDEGVVGAHEVDAEAEPGQQHEGPGGEQGGDDAALQAQEAEEEDEHHAQHEARPHEGHEDRHLLRRPVHTRRAQENG